MVPPVETGGAVNRRRSSMVRHSTQARPRGFAALASVIALVAAACSSGASTAPSAAAPSAAAPSVAAPSVAASAAASAAASGGTVHVAIVNKDMTPDEVKAAVKAEGTVTVGNWTYAATKEIVNQFQKFWDAGDVSKITENSEHGEADTLRNSGIHDQAQRPSQSGPVPQSAQDTNQRLVCGVVFP